MRSVARVLLFLTLIGVIFVATVHLSAGFRERRAASLYEPNGEVLELGNVKVHAYVEGEGPDLVLIHGASGNLRDFTFSMVDQLKDRYRVIALDRPGMGWSTQSDEFTAIWSRAGESPRQQARILKQAVDQLGAKSPLVLGHSFQIVVSPQAIHHIPP